MAEKKTIGVAAAAAASPSKDQNGAEAESMTPEQRLVWLRERGVTIETAEERRQKQIRDIMNEPDDAAAAAVTGGGGGYDSFTYVLVPADESKPMRELTLIRPPEVATRDLLPEHLKSYFAASEASAEDVDLSLLGGRAAGGALLGTDGAPASVSDEALREVASQASVETFPLVRPCPSNVFTGVNVYLDEVGMLKRLPLNRRAAKTAERAGFNPAPQFYGDVFLGRVSSGPKTGGSVTNADFRVGEDTSPDAAWLRMAVRENLEHQREMNRATAREETMPAAEGTDGVAKREIGGYSWTQDDDEIELVVPLADVGEEAATSRDVGVTFRSRSLSVKLRGAEVLNLELFAPVDVDGCTWTLERGEGEVQVVLTCEKTEEATWPRIRR